MIVLSCFLHLQLHRVIVTVLSHQPMMTVWSRITKHSRYFLRIPGSDHDTPFTLAAGQSCTLHVVGRKVSKVSTTLPHRSFLRESGPIRSTCHPPRAHASRMYSCGPLRSFPTTRLNGARQSAWLIPPIQPHTLVMSSDDRPRPLPGTTYSPSSFAPSSSLSLAVCQ